MERRRSSGGGEAAAPVGRELDEEEQGGVCRFRGSVGLRHALVRGCWGREEEQDEEREVQVSSWLKELREVMGGFSQEASELLDQVRHNAIRST